MGDLDIIFKVTESVSACTYAYDFYRCTIHSQCIYSLEFRSQRDKYACRPSPVFIIWQLIYIDETIHHLILKKLFITLMWWFTSLASSATFCKQHSLYTHVLFHVRAHQRLLVEWWWIGGIYCIIYRGSLSPQCSAWYATRSLSCSRPSSIYHLIFQTQVAVLSEWVTLYVLLHVIYINSMVNFIYKLIKMYKTLSNIEQNV